MGDTYDAGFNAGISEAVAIAKRWAEENRAGAAKARTRETRLAGLSMDHPGMAEMLDGAAIECNAIAQEIAALTPKEDNHA